MRPARISATARTAGGGCGMPDTGKYEMHDSGRSGRQGFGGVRRLCWTLQPNQQTGRSLHKFPTIVRFGDDYEIERDIWENGVKRTVREKVTKGETYRRPAGMLHVVRNVSDSTPLNFEKDEIQAPPGSGRIDGSTGSSEHEPDD
jgi:hypothetical protein